MGWDDMSQEEMSEDEKNYKMISEDEKNCNEMSEDEKNYKDMSVDEMSEVIFFLWVPGNLQMKCWMKNGIAAKGGIEKLGGLLSVRRVEDEMKLMRSIGKRYVMK